jgi:hypothetical protein
MTNFLECFPIVKLEKGSKDNLKELFSEYLKFDVMSLLGGVQHKLIFSMK